VVLASSIPPSPPHHTTIIQLVVPSGRGPAYSGPIRRGLIYNTTYNKHKIHIHKTESKHSELGPVRQNPIQRPVKLFKKLCNYIMLHNTTYLSSSVNLSSNCRPTYNSNVDTEVEGSFSDRVILC